MTPTVDRQKLERLLAGKPIRLVPMDPTEGPVLQRDAYLDHYVVRAMMPGERLLKVWVHPSELSDLDGVTIEEHLAVRLLEEARKDIALAKEILAAWEGVT